MSTTTIESFSQRLQKSDRHRSKLARRQDVDCFRVYDRELPQFPFVIDRYADQLLIAYFLPKNVREGDPTLSESLAAISESLGVPSSKIHLKERRTTIVRSDQYQKLADERDLLIVREGGLRFFVNLTDYLDTGLFFDHRATRAMFREQAKNRRVLNLFCYTGAFSVYAADGGAKKITSIDLSNTYLNWAQRNMALNRLHDPAKHEFVRMDVLKFLATATLDSYDLVILDPPTFSNSKSMQQSFDVQRDHAWLINQVLRILTDDGILYFSTNCRKFRLERDAIGADFVRDITKQTLPFDFTERMRRWCYVIKSPQRQTQNEPGNGHSDYGSKT